jgi:hypothetical protein
MPWLVMDQRSGNRMTANFWCWVPALALIPGSPGFLHRVDELHQLPAQPPATEIVQFVGNLEKRYPDLTEVGPDDNTAWADGPMLNNVNGGFIDSQSVGITTTRLRRSLLPLLTNTG